VEGEGCVMDVRGDGRPCTVVQPIFELKQQQNMVGIFWQSLE